MGVTVYGRGSAVHVGERAAELGELTVVGFHGDARVVALHRGVGGVAQDELVQLVVAASDASVADGGAGGRSHQIRVQEDHVHVRDGVLEGVGLPKHHLRLVDGVVGDLLHHGRVRIHHPQTVPFGVEHLDGAGLGGEAVRHRAAAVVQRVGGGVALRSHFGGGGELREGLVVQDDVHRGDACAFRLITLIAVTDLQSVLRVERIEAVHGKHTCLHDSGLRVLSHHVSFHAVVVKLDITGVFAKHVGVTNPLVESRLHS